MKCPVCNSEMTIKGKVGEPNGLPPEAGKALYYECANCRAYEKFHFAYQRVLFNGKWYYFNYARWNYLKEEEVFNPSRRMEN
jgi:hypothetical protein